MREMLTATVAGMLLATTVQAQQLQQKVNCVPVYSHIGTSNYGFQCDDGPEFYVVSQQQPVVGALELAQSVHDIRINFGPTVIANKVEVHKVECKLNPQHCQTLTFQYNPNQTINFGVGYTAKGFDATIDMDDGDIIDLTVPR